METIDFLYYYRAILLTENALNQNMIENEFFISWKSMQSSCILDSVFKHSYKSFTPT